MMKDMPEAARHQREMFDATQLGEDLSLGPSLSQAMSLSAQRIERALKEINPTHIVATVSGGRDSAAEIALAREMGIKIDIILHGRTGTGIQETTDHVIDHYGNLGPNLVIADAGTAYEEYVTRKGFFGIGRDAHNFAYRILKATPFRKAISREIRQGKRGVRVMLLNGARAPESDNRQKNLTEIRRDPAAPNNIWVNLIHDWTAGDRDRYLRINRTPINPVAVQLCRSGECMCGTMQSMQSRGEAAVLYPRWGSWLNDLERQVKAKFGWGWGEPMPKPKDLRQFEMFEPMCVGCTRDDLSLTDRSSLGSRA